MPWWYITDSIRHIILTIAGLLPIIQGQSFVFKETNYLFLHSTFGKRDCMNEPKDHVPCIVAEAALPISFIKL